jgi:acyl-CoA synthetase (AMP-forming)/AMP-acid ligase II
MKLQAQPLDTRTSLTSFYNTIKLPSPPSTFPYPINQSILDPFLVLILKFVKMPGALTTSSLPKGMGMGETLPCPFQTTTQAFYHYATKYPNATAVIDLSDGQRQLTYHQLASRAQSLARALTRLGVKPGQRIPLVVKRSVEMVVGIWAVLSCGAQYVPLDGGVVPDSSLRHVVEQAGDSVILCMGATEERLRKLLPHSQTVRIEDHWTTSPLVSSVGILDQATAEDGCYVIYTSGESV